MVLLLLLLLPAWLHVQQMVLHIMVPSISVLVHLDGKGYSVSVSVS